MKYEISLRAQSYIDLEESFLWYSNREENLGDEFLKQVEDCFERI